MGLLILPNQTQPLLGGLVLTPWSIAQYESESQHCQLIRRTWASDIIHHTAAMHRVRSVVLPAEAAVAAVAAEAAVAVVAVRERQRTPFC